MNDDLSRLDGSTFDVIVIGGGATGASAAQHLAARGFDTLLVDKGDFGSGTSSRSSRLLYCGLAHLSPDYPIWKFVLHPRDLLRRLRMAGLAMRCRAQLVQTMPERLTARTFLFPIYREGQYPGWKVDLGFRMLEALGLFRVSLNYRRRKVQTAARDHGLARLLSARNELSSVAIWREYQYAWPERICMDTVLDAERLGAETRNYARATGLKRDGEGWRVTLEDALMPGQQASVTARMVVNTAGPWVDRVNALTGQDTRPYLTGIKGVNVMVRLPEDCEGQGLEAISSINQPFYCMPWGKYHFIGPTETVCEGDPDTARVLPEEIDFVLDQANRLFPTLNLTRDDVVHSWCGVRPRTSSDAAAGIKALTLHELGDEGLPDMIALTGVPIMNHRYAGRVAADRVARTVTPSRSAQALSHAAKPFPDFPDSPPLDPEMPHVRLAHLRHAAQHERVRRLDDLLFRRTDIGWSPAMGQDAARRAADEVADILGWDAERTTREVAEYQAFVRENFAPAAPAAQVAR